jgi:hypothetical protein
VQPTSQTSSPITLPACDTTDVDYEKIIRPIFFDNCYGCHSTAATQTPNGNEGLDLEDTTSLRKYLKYDFNNDSIYGSRLYHCILHSLGALQMPPSYMLDSCSRKKIRHWLSIGAPIN